MNQFPNDMSPEMRLRLCWDAAIFGTAFYEATGDGYKRLDPLEMRIDDDGVVGHAGANIVTEDAPDGYYGTPHIESTE